jgi:hypothetical protein
VITLKDILAIDGGKQYIASRYADCQLSFDNPRRNFKLRDEKTASASIYCKEGIWYVTDFGGDSKRRNAVDICMVEDGVDFAEAIRRVAASYGMQGAGQITEVRPDYDKWPAKKNEPEGQCTFKFKEFDLFELQTIFSKNTWKHLGKDDESATKAAIAKLQYYHFKAVEYYNKTEDGVTRQVKRNNTFPIYIIDEGDFKKIYKPKAQKNARFSSTGAKPADLIHGISQLRDYVSEKRRDEEAEDNKSAKKAAENTFNDNSNISENDKKPKKQEYRESHWKVDKVILCTGGSDAINVAAMGYHVVWLNSETANFGYFQYKQLTDLAWEVYCLGDIDTTGLEKSHEINMAHLPIKNIRLPMSLLTKSDTKGNPMKDLRDFMNLYTEWDFRELIKVALPYQFWEKQDKIDKATGEPVMKFGKPVTEYVFKNLRAYNFLYWNGYARYQSEKEKEGYIFIKIDKHVVSEVLPSSIKDYVSNFLEKRYQPEDLRDLVYKTPQLSETSLANLPFKELDFKPFGSDFQYLFFQEWNNTKGKYDSVAWKVTADGIEETKKDVGFYVWESKVIKRLIKVEPKMFEISKATDRKFGNIKIESIESQVIKFLIQTCRLHWRLELEERLGICSRLKTIQERNEYCEKYQLTESEKGYIFNPKNTEDSDFTREYLQQYKFAIDGPLLTGKEIEEQKQCLENRFYVLGYLQHRFKNPSRPWGAWIMDGKIAEESESHGGSGKSLLKLLLENMNLNIISLDGRDAKLTANPHIFENVDKTTDIVNVDDLRDYFDFGHFFSALTSDMNVNPKNKKGFSLSFFESPKFIFSSNFGDRTIDPSSIRRKLYSVYSDYYHENNGDYNETRKPEQELGGNLFVDFDTRQWSLFYNFMAQCLSFYLSCDEKLVPPMGNVQKRNLISEMTETLKAWADVYFSDASRLNFWMKKSDAFDDFLKETNQKNYKSNHFKKQLKAWCKYNKYEFNPPMAGATNRKFKEYGPNQTVRETSAEHFYIKTGGGVPDVLEVVDSPETNNLFTPQSDPDAKTNF